MITRLFLMRPGTPGYDGNGKWWEITFPQAGDSERWHEVRWGAGLRSVGGSKRRFRYGSMHEARRHATRKISEKMGKGYVEADSFESSEAETARLLNWELTAPNRILLRFDGDPHLRQGGVFELSHWTNDREMVGRVVVLSVTRAGHRVAILAERHSAQMEIRSWQTGRGQGELIVTVWNQGGSPAAIGHVLTIGENGDLSGDGLANAALGQYRVVRLEPLTGGLWAMTIARIDSGHEAQLRRDQAIRQYAETTRNLEDDWGRLWDQLAAQFPSAEERRTVIAAIQERQRDRIAAEERSRRLAEIAERQAQTERDAELERARQLLAQHAKTSAPAFGRAKRKIDLSDED